MEEKSTWTNEIGMGQTAMLASLGTNSERALPNRQPQQNSSVYRRLTVLVYIHHSGFAVLSLPHNLS